jgi:hypothetical protein
MRPKTSAAVLASDAGLRWLRFLIGENHKRADTTVDTEPPPVQRTLAELLAQATLTASEFAAARDYLMAFTAGKTAVIDARMRNTDRDIVRNLLLEGLPVADALTRACRVTRGG